MAHYAWQVFANVTAAQILYVVRGDRGGLIEAKSIGIIYEMLCSSILECRMH